MRFAEFLRTAVLLTAGAATLLAALTVLRVAEEGDPVAAGFSLVWWLAAGIIGLTLGRHNDLNPPIARLLADARPTTILPELRPGAILLNRMWSLLVFVLVAGIGGYFVVQVAAVATGFALVLPLSLRRQERAVAAIEERDAARFYVERTAPLRPIRLIRTPGFGGDFLAADGYGPA